MKTSLRFAGRIWAYYILCLFLCLLFVSSIQSAWLQIPINVALLVGLLLMCYNEGGYRGERACTLAASIEKQLKDGRAFDPEVASQVWKPAVAVKMVAIFVLPLWLLAAANLVAAPFYPDVDEMVAAQLAADAAATPAPDAAAATVAPADAVATQAPDAAATVAPTAATEVTQAPDAATTTVAPTADAAVTPAPDASVVTAAPDASLSPDASAAPEGEPFDPSTFNWFHVATRLVFMPFVFTFVLLPQKVLSLLYFVYALPFPLVAMWGYLNGPKLRNTKLKAMYKGKRRKMRNLKVNRQPRKPKAEV